LKRSGGLHAGVLLVGRRNEGRTEGRKEGRRRHTITQGAISRISRKLHFRSVHSLDWMDGWSEYLERKNYYYCRCSRVCTYRVYQTLTLRLVLLVFTCRVSFLPPIFATEFAAHPWFIIRVIHKIPLDCLERKRLSQSRKVDELISFLPYWVKRKHYFF
jgi:hypothetical protein